MLNDEELFEYWFEDALECPLRQLPYHHLRCYRPKVWSGIFLKRVLGWCGVEEAIRTHDELVAEAAAMGGVE